MKLKLLILLMFVSLGAFAQQSHFTHMGASVQAKRTSLDFGFGFRNKQFVTKVGVVGSVFGLRNTYAYEYSTQAKVNVHYHVLNYGFLHKWNSNKKQHRWTPYVNVGASAGTRYIQNYDHVIYEDVDRWNLLYEGEASIGVKWSPRHFLTSRQNGWFTLFADIGVVKSNMDGLYPNFNLGFSYVLGY